MKFGLEGSYRRRHKCRMTNTLATESHRHTKTVVFLFPCLSVAIIDLKTEETRTSERGTRNLNHESWILNLFYFTVSISQSLSRSRGLSARRINGDANEMTAMMINIRLMGF